MLAPFIHSIQPYFTGIAFLIIYAAEHLLPQRSQSAFSRHDMINFLVGVFNAAFSFAGGYYLQKILVWSGLHHVGLFNMINIHSFILLPFQLLLLDVFMYWWHRWNHQLPFLWRFHHFHHTDLSMNSTTALRFHVVELILSYVVKAIVFPIIGFNISAILFYSLLFLPVVILHHSNIAIREKTDLVIRQILVTPLMHRIHHSDKKLETNSNYSSVFPWWDRLFRSYRHKPLGSISFGVQDLPPHNK